MPRRRLRDVRVREDAADDDETRRGRWLAGDARARRGTTRAGRRRARGIVAGARARERARAASERAPGRSGGTRAPRSRGGGGPSRPPRLPLPPPPPPPRSRGAPPRALQRVFPFPAGKSRLAARLARAPARAPRIGRVRPPRDDRPRLRSTARRGRRRRRERRTRARAAPRIAGPPDRVVVRGRSAPCAPQARIKQAGKRSHREPASRSGLTRRTVFGFWFLVFGFWFLLTFKGGKDSRVDDRRRGRSDGHPSPLPFPSREKTTTPRAPPFNS